jgi:hypothetical protein
MWAKKSDLSGDITTQNGRRKTNDEIELIIRKKSADQINNNDLIRIENESSDYRINSIFDSQHKYFTTLKATKLS